jgi:coenzyme F420 hydrogenase subunit beta
VLYLCPKKLVNTIEYVVKENLCTGCGTCDSFCSSKAIAMYLSPELGIYLPRIDSSKCSGCQICSKVCPGAIVDFKGLSKKVTPQQNVQPKSILIGNYINCYSGYSNNYSIRFDSSSGGIVTQLLIFALENKLIDGALVTRIRKDRPLEPESFIARTPEEIIEASKSKYCPVSANVALKEIMEQDGRYAVVGLPCHIHGLRKAQGIYKKLSERVVLSIGIMCSHTDSFFSIMHVLNRYEIDLKDVSHISYRGKGWPGILKIEQKSGKITEIPYDDWIRVHEYCFFTPDRCLVCCDHAAELADIACGDAWLSEFSKDRIGTSLIISRNAVSEKILQAAISAGVLHLNIINAGKIVKSQGNVRFKKNSFRVRVFLFKLFRKAVPYYNIDLPRTRIIDWGRSLIIFVNRRAASNGIFKHDIERLIAWQRKLKRLYMIAIN